MPEITNSYNDAIRVPLDAQYIPQEVTFNGRPHIVVPVVMLTEGVHFGSAGPVYFSAEEIARFPAAWDGIPIVVQHPELTISPTGSANIPELAESIVGRVYNTHWDNGKLKANAYIDVGAAEAVSRETIDRLRAAEPMEVSVGVFSDDERVNGQWHDEPYVMVSRNFRPNHLAVLPDCRGACSIDDGCGVRTNKEEGVTMKKDKKFLQALQERLITAKPESVTLNEDGYRALIREIQHQLDMMDGPAGIHYLEEVFDDRFVYRVESSGAMPALYERSYTVGNDGAVTFGTEPAQVENRYVRVNTNQEEGEKVMPKKFDGCCEEKVVLLVESGIFGTEGTETITDALGKLPESIIDGLIVLKDAVVGKDAEILALKEAAEKGDAGAVTTETVLHALKGEGGEDITGVLLQALKGAISDKGQFLTLLSDDMRGSFEHGLKLHAEFREKMSAHILKHAGDQWTAEKLVKMDDDMLKSLAETVQPRADFSLQPGERVKTHAGPGADEVLAPVGVTAATA